MAPYALLGILKADRATLSIFENLAKMHLY